MSEPGEDDTRWLDAAVRYARPRLGTTGGAPASVALVVDDGLGIVFARAMDLGTALAEARVAAAGRTLYLTLEPPVSETAAIVEAAPGRVVIGMLHPDRAERGRAVAALSEASIAVDVADHAPSRELLSSYAHRVTRNRPHTTLALAVSTDGMIGRRDGVPMDLMGDAARRWLGLQRALSDAVMIGARTAELDDPSLDPVLPGLEARPYARIVLVGSRAPPANLRLLRGGPAWIVAEPSKAFGLPPPVEFITVDGRNDRPDLRKAMAALAGRGVSSVLVEAGAKLTEAMLAAELADRFHLIETPVEVGRAGLPATALGTIHGRLRAAGFVEVTAGELGADRLRTYERQL